MRLLQIVQSFIQQINENQMLHESIRQQADHDLQNLTHQTADDFSNQHQMNHQFLNHTHHETVNHIDHMNHMGGMGF